jgi:hypothetical protein
MNKIFTLPIQYRLLCRYRVRSEDKGLDEYDRDAIYCTVQYSALRINKLINFLTVVHRVGYLLA